MRNERGTAWRSSDPGLAACPVDGLGRSVVDLIIGLALGDETPETYRTLQNNLKTSGFEQGKPSFR